MSRKDFALVQKLPCHKSSARKTRSAISGAVAGGAAINRETSLDLTLGAASIRAAVRTTG
jgi:hypothetical protein